MKITLILLLTTAFSAFSMDVHSQNAKVSLDTNIMKVAQLISAIESQTNYLFVYSKKNVDLSRKVKINAKNKAVSEILDEVFPELVSLMLWKVKTLFWQKKAI